MKTVFTRLRLSLVAGVVLVAAAGIMVAGASAQTPGGGLPPGPIGGINAAGGFAPTDFNIPSLAWRGEQIRFVKCDPLLNGAVGTVLPNAPSNAAQAAGWRANLWVEDFSAPNNTDGTAVPWPQPISGSFQFFQSQHFGTGCVRGTFSSNKAGMAVIKLSVNLPNGQQLVVHQFLAGWMAINSATMTNAGARPAELPGSSAVNTANVQVTGRIPINSEFQTDWALPANLILPNDWALWASRMATGIQLFQQVRPDISPSQYWDIHDSSSPVSADTADTHVPGVCAGTSTTTDQVDNCVVTAGANGEFGRFSRVFGNLSGNPTIGPFDANYAEVLLSDGNLNAADAPMPPLRIDFSNSGPFGAFLNSPSSDKHVVYSRNGLGSNTAHNLYAPYYAAYIPATSRGFGIDDSSGTDGPIFAPGTLQPNNFEGYQQAYGVPYHYWNIVRVLQNAVGGNSPCVLTSGNERDLFRQLNSGPKSIVEYLQGRFAAVAAS